jgi:Pentapeptide repeats (9 copies)
MAGLADDWEENRQTCVDVLRAFLRMPYEPDRRQGAPTAERLAFGAGREVRHTVIRLITAHLLPGALVSWQGLDFDFSGIRFDGGYFRGAEFSGRVNFRGAAFSGGEVDFSVAGYYGREVYFRGAVFSYGRVGFDSARFSGVEVSFYDAVFSGGRVSAAVCHLLVVGPAGSATSRRRARQGRDVREAALDQSGHAPNLVRSAPAAIARAGLSGARARQQPQASAADRDQPSRNSRHQALPPLLDHPADLAHTSLVCPANTARPSHGTCQRSDTQSSVLIAGVAYQLCK